MNILLSIHPSASLDQNSKTIKRCIITRGKYLVRNYRIYRRIFWFANTVCSYKNFSSQTKYSPSENPPLQLEQIKIFISSILDTLSEYNRHILRVNGAKDLFSHHFMYLRPRECFLSYFCILYVRITAHAFIILVILFTFLLGIHPSIC